MKVVSPNPSEKPSTVHATFCFRKINSHAVTEEVNILIRHCGNPVEVVWIKLGSGPSRSSSFPFDYGSRDSYRLPCIVKRSHSWLTPDDQILSHACIYSYTSRLRNSNFDSNLSEIFYRIAQTDFFEQKCVSEKIYTIGFLTLPSFFQQPTLEF